MWEFSGWIAWVVSALIFIWLIYDFLAVHLKYSERALTDAAVTDELLAKKGEE